MTRDDTEPTSGIDSESPGRKDVLDEVSGRERDGLAGASEPAGAGSAGPTASRRSVLATAGAIGATALSGCLGVLTGETAEFHAPPALLPLPPIKERRNRDIRLEMTPVQIVQARKTIKRFGLSREAVATIWGATYQVTDGEEVHGEVTLLSAPKVQIRGREFNPLARASAREVVESVGRGGEIARGEGESAGDRALQATALDLDEGAALASAAYAGDIAAVSDVHLQEGGARDLAASDERPVLFGATARRRQDGADRRLVGGVQRFDVEDALVFQVTTSYLPEGAPREFSATARFGDPADWASTVAVDSGDSPEALYVATGQVGDIGDLGGDGDDPLLTECQINLKSCLYDCDDRHVAGQLSDGEWELCCLACHDDYDCCYQGRCGRDGGVVVTNPANDVTAYPLVRADHIDRCGLGAGVDAEICIGDLVAEHAELQISERITR